MLFAIIIFFLFSVIAVALAVSILKKLPKSLPPAETQAQPLIEYKSIFAPDEEELRALEAEETAKTRELFRQEILARAGTLDFNSLIEAKVFEAEFYDRVLTELALRCDEENFGALCSFVAQYKLRTNGELVRRFQSIYKDSPGRNGTIQLLHFAALSESAKIFSDSFEIVIQLSREDGLKDFTLQNLVRLAESEFWLLPAAEKTSGAGFLLKQRLARLRAEVQEK